MTAAMLQEFADAMGDKDIEKIASFFTHDCIFKASVGPEPGKTYEGKKCVMNGIKDMISHDSGGKSSIENIRIFESFGVYEWLYEFQDKSIVRGCDLFKFRGDKIKEINAFRKTFL